MTRNLLSGWRAIATYTAIALLLGIFYFLVLTKVWPEQPLVPLLLESSLWFLSLALLGAGLLNIFAFYQPSRQSWALVLLLPLPLAVLQAFGVKFVLPWFLAAEPITQDLEYWLWLRAWLSYLILAGLSAWSMQWYRVMRLREDLQRHGELSELAREAELATLRQQLQPHFLYNSLNSVNALMGSRPEQARDMLHKLAAFLRGSLRHERKTLMPLSEEVEHLQLYLSIEQVRFGHRLQVEYQLPDNPENYQVPPLILQPLVENAIKHGLNQTEGDFLLQIQLRDRDNYLEARVINPWAPEAASRSGTQFGLHSVKRRLYLLYGRVDLLEVQAESELFQVILKIPKQRDTSTDHR